MKVKKTPKEYISNQWHTQGFSTRGPPMQDFDAPSWIFPISNTKKLSTFWRPLFSPPHFINIVEQGKNQNQKHKRIFFLRPIYSFSFFAILVKPTSPSPDTEYVPGNALLSRRILPVFWLKLIATKMDFFFFYSFLSCSCEIMFSALSDKNILLYMYYI